MSEAAVLLMVKMVFAVSALVALGFFVVRPVWRMLRDQPDADLLDPMNSMDLEPLEGEEELEIPTGGKAGLPSRSVILEQAKKDPRATANAISRWLTEKR